jgi:membrane-bound lytic murein transglycosylase B
VGWFVTTDRPDVGDPPTEVPAKVVRFRLPRRARLRPRAAVTAGVATALSAAVAVAPAVATPSASGSAPVDRSSAWSAFLLGQIGGAAGNDADGVTAGEVSTPPTAIPGTEPAVAAATEPTGISVPIVPDLTDAAHLRLVGGLSVPVILMAAYQQAVTAAPASCHLTLGLLAAIGQVESGSLAGRTLTASHRAVPPVIGPALNGTGVAAIPDSDGGALDADTAWDHAVGPMQFLPGSWRTWGRDGDGDGIADPQDVEDAAAAAGALLCAAGGDLAVSGGLRRAILAYNRSSAYLQSVLFVMATRPVYQLGPVHPWTVAVANVIGPKFGIRSIGGHRAGPDAEDHELGLGLDFMVNADAASGRALAQFVQAHASELGVHYIIWQQHIWNVDRPAEGWRLMEDRGSPTQNHLDHVHVSLFNVAGSLTDLGGSPIAPLRWPTPWVLPSTGLPTAVSPAAAPGSSIPSATSSLPTPAPNPTAAPVSPTSGTTAALSSATVTTTSEPTSSPSTTSATSAASTTSTPSTTFPTSTPSPSTILTSTTTSEATSSAPTTTTTSSSPSETTSANAEPAPSTTESTTTSTTESTAPTATP